MRTGLRRLWERLPDLLTVGLVTMLAACRTAPAPTVYSPSSTPANAPVPVEISEDELRRSRVLADLLYDASNAYDENRLMLPAGNNAYEIYQEVLQLDPGNAVAMAGIKDIALRYVTLAEAAISQGEYTDADNYLNRAQRLTPDRPEIAITKARLEQVRKNRVDVHELDADALRAQSLEVMTTLAEIAQQIQRSGATFLIRARSDEEGRWIYKTMRDAVGGYRLRGNIEVAGTPAIVLSNGVSQASPVSE